MSKRSKSAGLAAIKRQIDRSVARATKNAKITPGTVKAIKYGGIFALGALVAHSLSRR